VEGIRFDVQGCHLLVGDLDALLVIIGIKLTGDSEAGLGGGAGDAAEQDVKGGGQRSEFVISFL